MQVVRWRRLFCGGMGGCESVNGLQRTSLGHRWGCRAGCSRAREQLVCTSTLVDVAQSWPEEGFLLSQVGRQCSERVGQMGANQYLRGGVTCR